MTQRHTERLSETETEREREKERESDRQTDLVRQRQTDRLSCEIGKDRETKRKT